MVNRIHHIVLLVIIIFSFQFASAQSVSVKASIDSEQIVIGEPIHLVLEASLPLGESAQWFRLDSLQHFELLSAGKIDTIISSQGKVFRQMFTITSFDSGKWTIPALPLQVSNQQFFTDSLPVTVSYSPFDPKQDYHDIKDIIVVDNPFLKYIHWIIAAITILSLLLVAYFIRKIKRTPAPKQNTFASHLSPLQEAMEALQQLQKQPMQDSNDVKKYYSQLNDIVRRYWWRKTNWAALEKTTGELVQQLSFTALPHDDKINFVQQLRMMDAVKFAKFIPSFDENKIAFETSKKSIQLLDAILNN